MSEGDNKPASPNPGTFSDGRTYNEFASQFASDEGQAKSTKETLIAMALENGTISSEFAGLLSQIHSSTMGAEGATLKKVESVLSLHGNSDLAGISEGKVAYIGSGSDWEFPVALGARDIDMVDIDFVKGKNSLHSELLERVRVNDKNAVINENDEIIFQGNFGMGREEVRLKIRGVEADNYEPDGEVKGVIEYNSPHGGFIELLREKISPHVSNGALILNFDFRNEDPKPEGVSPNDLPRGKFYKVNDIASFRKWLEDQPRPKGIDINSIRDQVKKK